jgi:hypothetical protein
MGKMKNATTGRGDSRCAGYYNVHRERGYREFYERFYCRDQSRSFLMDRIGYRGVEGGGDEVGVSLPLRSKTRAIYGAGDTATPPAAASIQSYKATSDTWIRESLRLFRLLVFPDGRRRRESNYARRVRPAPSNGAAI